ncbi:dynein axonemal heavy chain 17-like isoform X1 [Hippocampus zosterae]|uniref:dynein axonemal heavy chain 17-like isoform X1 n=1 Tax=Hippocampus zosterae TaxID=109293 RepID=UPI00223E7FCE|nr:dynein axonemal heavy chain 17-like isoform X1 [Hippocampus zosterae]
MEASDKRVELLKPLVVQSLHLDEEKWRELVSVKKHLVYLNNFFNTKEMVNLYMWLNADGGACMSLDFPVAGHKVICLGKTHKDMVTVDNMAATMLIEEIHADNVLTFLSTLTQEVICPLLSNPANADGWAPGAAEEILNLMDKLKNQSLSMKAHKEGWTFLPLPKHLHDDQDRKPCDLKLLHGCESVIVEWAGIVSEFLQQNPAQPLLEGLKPSPSEEFNFWSNRLRNLQLILEQMSSDSAQKVASFLQLSQGAYCDTLKNIHDEAQKGLTEAEDANNNLLPLQHEVEQLEQLDYPQLRDNMAAVMEKVHQVWIRSRFHCNPCWIVVLLQEICNLFIERSRTFLQGQEVMRGLVLDPAQVLDDVRVVTLTLQTLKDKYIHHRMLLEKEDGGLHKWEFPSHLVFSRLDDFLIRLQSIQEVYRVRLQFQLEQVVVAGGRGRQWTSAVKGVCNDFLHQLQILADCKSDASDPADGSFGQQATSFEEHVSHLEARLVTILRGTLDECCLPSAAVKVVTMFGPVLQRPAIRDQLRPQLSSLVTMVLRELDRVQEMVKSKAKNHVSSKFTTSPVVTLRWTKQLMLRAYNVLHNFQSVQNLCVEASEAVRQKFQKIADLLLEIRNSVRQEFSRQLDRDAAAVLQLPLIQEQQSKLEIPCGQKLEALLSDIKQASWEKDLELRPQTAEILRCGRDITKSYLSLTNIVSSYNEVVGRALMVELPLIKDALEEQRMSLLELQKITWTSEGVHELMETKRQSLVVFYTSVNEARANMAAMRAITQDWEALPLVNRSGDFLERGGATEESYTRVREDGEQVIRLVTENSVLYGVKDESSPEWSAYLDHIDQLVQDGVLQMLLHSLKFLSENMSPTEYMGGGALLQVSLQLQPMGCIFEPSLTTDLIKVFKSFVADIYAAASLPPRISTTQIGNYQEALRDNEELVALEKVVMQHLVDVNEEAERLRADLDRFSPLWHSHKRLIMQEFLTYGRRLEEGEEDVEESPPMLADFQREINALQKQLLEVSELEDYYLVHGWLQVDLQPFKDGLRLFIHNWISLYTQHLLKLVRHNMSRRSLDDEEEEVDKSSGRNFPMTETIMLLETVNVEVPEITTLLQTGGHLVAEPKAK